MRWTKARVEIFIEYYTPLKEYELNPWQEEVNYSGERIVKGKGGRFRAPFEMQAILNAEFDLGIKSLGELGEKVFRLRWLDGKTLDEINKLLPEPYGEIKEKWRSVKRDLINWLLESEK